MSHVEALRGHSLGKVSITQYKNYQYISLYSRALSWWCHYWEKYIEGCYCILFYYDSDTWTSLYKGDWCWFWMKHFTKLVREGYFSTSLINHSLINVIFVKHLSPTKRYHNVSPITVIHINQVNNETQPVINYCNKENLSLKPLLFHFKPSDYLPQKINFFLSC